MKQKKLTTLHTFTGGDITSTEREWARARLTSHTSISCEITFVSWVNHKHEHVTEPNLKICGVASSDRLWEEERRNRGCCGYSIRLQNQLIGLAAAIVSPPETETDQRSRNRLSAVASRVASAAVVGKVSWTQTDLDWALPDLRVCWVACFRVTLNILWHRRCCWQVSWHCCYSQQTSVRFCQTTWYSLWHLRDLRCNNSVKTYKRLPKKGYLWK